MKIRKNKDEKKQIKYNINEFEDMLIYWTDVQAVQGLSTPEEKYANQLQIPD